MSSRQDTPESCNCSGLGFNRITATLQSNPIKFPTLLLSYIAPFSRL